MTKVDSSVDTSPTEPALGFSYSIALDDKKSLVLQSFLPRNCTLTQLNGLLDTMSAAADRQAAKGQLKALKRSLAMQMKQLRRATEDLYTIDERNQQAWNLSGKKGKFRNSSDQEAHRRNVVVTQERFNEEITDINREISELEALLLAGG